MTTVAPDACQARDASGSRTSGFMGLVTALASARRLGYNGIKDTRGRVRPTMSSTQHPAPLYRYILAWAVMVGGLVGFWCCRPWLGTRAFNIGQVVVLLVTWKVASLLCLPPEAWARFTPFRFLAYCVWLGMQPRQFLEGQQTARRCPGADGARVPPQRGHRGGPGLARAAPAAGRDPLAGPLLDRAWWASASWASSRGSTSMR